MNLKELGVRYYYSKKGYEQAREDLILTIKQHPELKNCDEYLEGIEFKETGISVPCKRWTGPDEIERFQKFFHYSEFPDLDIF